MTIAMRRVALCAALALLTGAARAQDGQAGQGGADGQGQVSLTIYNSNLALVEDVRQLNLPAGRSRLEFKDVSSAIRPETVALSGRGLTVVEQNFDYDLLTPAKMMEKAVGKQIQIVRTNPGTGKETTETATVLSVNQGVVLKIGDHVEVLRDDGIPTRVIFDGIPQNLRARPTLSVTVDADGAGPRAATLSYLTTGLSWTADYVAQFDDKAGTLALQGWVTLTNNSGTSFNDVTPRLVAGEVSLGNNGPRNVYRPPVANRGGGTGDSTMANAEDFPVYSLPEKVTVAENQTKQVGFLDVAGLKAQKVYQYRSFGFRSQQAPDHANVVLNFSNTGKAMPAGTVRVYMRDSAGVPKFVGEENIDQTPAGSDLSLKLGEAFDVTVKPTLESSDSLANDRARYHMRYELHNAGAAPVTVELRQSGLNGNNDVISGESQPGKRVDAFTQEWDVPVPAHGATTLSFTATAGG